MKYILLLAVSATVSQAAPFQFTAVIRAGSGSTWQLGIGTDANNISSTDTISFPAGQTPENFVVGYDHTLNVAFASYLSQGGNVLSLVTLNGPGNITGATRWSLPTLSVTAAQIVPASELKADQLTLSGGLSGAITVISPLQQTILDANRAANGAAVTAAESAPVVFTGGGGDWLLTGRLTWKGLSTQVAGGATGSQLGFTISATTGAIAAATPEPGSALLMLSAGPLLWFIRRRR